jgi:hypothetical protein
MSDLRSQSSIALSEQKGTAMGMQPIAALLIREISDSSMQGALAGDPVSGEPATRTTKRRKTRRGRRTGLGLGSLSGLLASRG